MSACTWPDGGTDDGVGETVAAYASEFCRTLSFLAWIRFSMMEFAVFANRRFRDAIEKLAGAFAEGPLASRIFFMALAGIYSLAPYVVFACRAVGAPWGLALATVRFDGGGGFRPLRVVE